MKSLQYQFLYTRDFACREDDLLMKSIFEYAEQEVCVTAASRAFATRENPKHVKGWVDFEIHEDEDELFFRGAQGAFLSGTEWQVPRSLDTLVTFRGSKLCGGLGVTFQRVVYNSLG
jgi:hypothetical protein